LTRLISAFAAACVACLSATPAMAGEVFGGFYVHDIDSPLTKSGVESGIDLQLGWRGDPLTALKIQPHAFVSVNSAGNTHYAAVGISRKFGDRVYIRPGVGIDRERAHVRLSRNDRIRRPREIVARGRDDTHAGGGGIGGDRRRGCRGQQRGHQRQQAYKRGDHGCISSRFGV